MSDDHLRMSDAERDQAAAALGEHYAQGRLTADEHGERLDQVWAARTRGELRPIFADLPVAAGSPVVGAGAPSRGGGTRRSTGPRRFRGMPVPLVVLLAVLVAVTVVAHLPIILVGLLAWFLLSRHGACSPPAVRPTRHR